MEIRIGDFGYDINFTVYKSDGVTPEVITGLVIKFQISEVESNRNILDGACVIVLGTAGTCKYTVKDGDFTKDGNYVGCLKITYSAGRIETTEDMFITIKKALK